MIERVKSAMVGAGASWVLWLLLVLSVISLAIMLERAWLYWSIRDDFAGLMKDLGRLLRGGDMEGARRRLEQSPSAEAAVVIAGLVESELGAKAAEEAMAGASALQRIKLEKRLAFLGTLGNNAPFIGLLGTVIGLLGSFDALGQARPLAQGGTDSVSSQLAPQAVMSNIAEALVATAVGILVAIPAVAAYNAFQRAVKTTAANTDALSSVLLSHLYSNGLVEGAPAPVRAAPRASGAPPASRGGDPGSDPPPRSRSEGAS